MKSNFDKKTVQRSFQPGDSVPVSGSVFDDKFSGPYVIEQKLNDTDYVVNTPDRHRKKRCVILTCQKVMLHVILPRLFFPHQH